MECDLQDKESGGKKNVWQAILCVLSGPVFSKSLQNTALTPED